MTTQPAISPDGKLLVYSSDRDGQNNLDLYVLQLPSGSPVRITSTDEDETEAAFSPDGASIAFHSTKGDGSIYIMPALGGEPRLLVRGGQSPRFSPDGTSISYYTGSVTSGDPFAEGASKSFIIAMSGGTPRQIQPEFSVVRYPIWSPDGKRIAFEGVAAGTTSRTSRMDLWTTPADGGTVERSGLFQVFANQRILVKAWTRDGLVVTLGNSVNIYSVPVSETGKVSASAWQLTNGTEFIESASLSNSGRMVFASARQQNNIWSIPLNGNTGKPTASARRITYDLAAISGFCLTAGGNNLVYASTRNGPWQIWMREFASTKSKLMVAGPGLNLAPACLPSGRIAFRSEQGGKILDPQTGEFQILAKEQVYILNSSSNEEFATLRAQVGDLAAIDLLELRTGKAAPLLRASKWNIYQGRISPNANWVAFLANISATQGRIYVARLNEMQQLPQSKWLPIVDGRVDKPRFSPDGKLIYFTRDGEGSRRIHAVRFDPETGKPAGEPFLVYDFRGPRVSMVPVNTSPLDLDIAAGKLVTLVAESQSNIWMAELNPQPPRAPK